MTDTPSTGVALFSGVEKDDNLAKTNRIKYSWNATDKINIQDKNVTKVV
jgi:hypothetical protein